MQSLQVAGDEPISCRGSLESGTRICSTRCCSGSPGRPTGASNEEAAVPPLPSSQEAPPRKSGGGTVVVVTDDGKEIDLRKSTADWSAAVDQQDLRAMMGRLRALKA
jgi:hypothetical protein